MPTTMPDAISSRQHSMSTFSVNGSPTCTDGSFLRPFPDSSPSKVSLASTDTPPMPSSPVRAPNRMILLPAPDANARCRSSVRSAPTHRALTSGLPAYDGVEDDLAADVGQAERVAVAADARHDAGQHPARVGRVGGAEPQRVGDGDRPRAHRHDVAHDPADAGGRALVGLDVGRVVVRLDLERDGPPVADRDHARVLPDPGEHPLAHRGRGRLAEVGEVHLRGLVGAVLAPHDRVHRELGVGGAAAEDLPDARVLVVLQAQLTVGLRMLGGGGGVLDGVGRCNGRHGSQPTFAPPGRPGGARCSLLRRVGSWTTLTKKWSICLIASMNPSKSTGLVT